MSLSLYNKKRRFDETSEPEGAVKSSKKALRFVIQKHDASSLHYDFRLELEGVLKSWAVPKGPSLNPADKRLAMHVEDHPYDYRNFEGIIPEGNYGGGTVIVWDEGTYTIEDGADLSHVESEKALAKAYRSGNLKITLAGKKIRGSFSLRKLRKEGVEKAWLLIKSKDNFAGTEDITKMDASVKSGKTIAQVAEENGTVPNHPEGGSKPKRGEVTLLSKSPRSTAPKKKASGSSKKKADVKNLIGSLGTGARQTSIPRNVKPMLATLTDGSFDDKDWLFEIKWDGYRAVAYVERDEVELISRNNKSYLEKYAPVADALRALNLNAVLDGEIVAVDDKGLANFQQLQNWQNTPVKLQFFVFDLLWLDGYDVTALPLVQRKELLRKLLPTDHEVVRYSDHVVEKGKDFFEVALAKGLEGVMAKKTDSIYEINARTEAWLKVKVNLRQEVVIVGYTKPRNTRTFFGALMLGVYDQGELVYIGHTGSGFDKKRLESVYNRLQPMVVADCPFAKCPKGNMPVTWVKPELVCEIKFTEWTKERMARHPIFMGLREDKSAADVQFEKSTTIKTMVDKSAGKVSKKAATPAKDTKASAPKRAAGKSASGRSRVKSSGLELSLDEGDEQHVTVDKHDLKLTSLSKVYWKKDKALKLDSINHYFRVAPYMLPYLIDRPHSLNRHPSGIDAPNFFQKDMKGSAPEWMQTHVDFSESTNQDVQYLVCSNEASLIYMANLGCIEINPWHSRAQTWQQPDWCLIDLDPDKSNTFDEVVLVAQEVKKVLDAIGADAFVKTSGASGIHIYIPLGGQYNFEQSKSLAELVVNLVQQELPDLTSVERMPVKRKGKVYLDFLQNRETQTAAAPYSLRPKPGVPVSTPLHWDEVKKGLTPTTFNMRNIVERLASEGDLFKGVLGKGINLQKVLGKLETIMK